MPTWKDFRYGPQIHQKGLYWDPEEGVLPTTGQQRPWIMYVGGGGWAQSHPKAFFDPRLGEGLFTGFIEPNAGAPDQDHFPVVAFAPWVSEGFYNLRDATHSGWQWPNGGGSGDWRYGEYLKAPVKGHPYRCIRAHAGETGKIPGGADAIDEISTGWSGFWERSYTNDVLNKRFDHAAFTPRYRDSGARDAAKCVQYIKTFSGFYGIAPENGILMGASAGGQQVGIVAYDYSEPYSSIASKVVGDEWAYGVSSKPKGVILDITPDDWRHYEDMFILMDNLFGVSQTQAAWTGDAGQAAWPDSKKQALAPLGVLKGTRESIPTLLTNTSFTMTGSDGIRIVPPWDTPAFHEAYAAFQTFDYLTGVLGQEGCEFWHADNVVDRESPEAERIRRHWDWATGLWKS